MFRLTEDSRRGVVAQYIQAAGLLTHKLNKYGGTDAFLTVFKSNRIVPVRYHVDRILHILIQVIVSIYLWRKSNMTHSRYVDCETCRVNIFRHRITFIQCRSLGLVTH